MEKRYPAARALFEITPEIEHLAELCEKNTAIDKELYTKYEVKRGLRDLNGKGVLAGLTNISDIIAKKVVDGQEVPCEGELYYRGYNIKELVKGFLDADHYGFEEITYLLLFGELPDEKEAAGYSKATKALMDGSKLKGLGWQAAWDMEKFKMISAQLRNYFHSKRWG